MCKPGFSSDDLGDEFCYRPNCYVHSDERMQKGCVPVFHEDDCCPWEWVCPKAGGGITDDPEEAYHGDDNDDIVEDTSSSPEVVRVPCPPGSEPIEDFPYLPMVTLPIGILQDEDSLQTERLPGTKFN